MNTKLMAAMVAALMIVPVSIMLSADDSDATSTVSATFVKDVRYNLIAGTYDYSYDGSGHVQLRSESNQSIYINPGSGTITIPLSGAYWQDDMSSATIEFNKDPRIPVSPGPTPTEHVTTHSVSAWLKSSLGSGTYYCNSTVYAVKADSDDQARFESEVVSKNITSFEPSDYNMRTLGSRPTLDGDYTLYMISQLKYAGSAQSVQIDKETGPSQYTVQFVAFHAVPEDWYSFYVSAYRTFEITVQFGSDVKYMYLYGSNGSAFVLESGKQYSVTTTTGVNYYLEADTGSSMKSVDVLIDVNGASQPDSYGTVFAGACVVVCALIFGLLLVSGRKPAWAKKD